MIRADRGIDVVLRMSDPYATSAVMPTLTEKKAWPNAARTMSVSSLLKSGVNRNSIARANSPTCAA